MATSGAKRTFGEMPTSAKCCHERTHAVPQTTPPLDHLVGNRLLNNGVSLHDRQRFANFWKQPIETSEYQAVEDAERESLRSSPPQNVYLLPQCPNLCLERCPHTTASPDSRSTTNQNEVQRIQEYGLISF
jgi:hypothetical protein